MNVTTNKKSELTFYDVLLIWIGIVSALIMITLAIGKFSPPVILIGSCILTIMILILVRIQLIHEMRFTQVFFLLLFLALLFRYSNATHYMGGQDQGLYVNMSATMTRSGKIDFVDRLRESLPKDLQIEYGTNTEFDTSDDPGVGGVDNPKTSTYSVDFYPMHPAWMAIATFLFGSGKHILSVLFFSLVGLSGMFLLTMELTQDNKKAGYITLLFGALNPGMVYFSTYPVGEMVALGFSINGFYLLSRGFHCQDKNLRYLFLAGSALLFSAFCYTRMTFFLFFPVIFLVLFIAFFLEQYAHLRNSQLVYVGSLIFLFMLSWVFYYKYQFDLADPMYRQAFKPLLDRYGLIFLAGIVIMTALLFGLSQTKFRNKLYVLAENVVFWLEKYVAFLLFIVLTLSFFLILNLYKEGITSIALVMHVLKPNPLIFQFSNLYRLMQFISPVLLPLLFVIPVIRIKLQGGQILLIFLLTICWLSILFEQPYYVWLYYFGRYLCSEMVPYSLILCGIVLSVFLEKDQWKKIAVILISLTVIYFAIFSVVQIGHPETENPEVLIQLDRLVGSNDVIVYENMSSLGDNEHGLLIKTPLRLYFNKQVFPLRRTLPDDERFRIINYFFNNSAAKSGSKYGIIYLLEHGPIASEMRNSLTFVGKFDYSYGRLTNPYEYKLGPITDTWKQILLPYHYAESHAPLYLYRVAKNLTQPLPLNDFNIDFSQNGNSNNVELTGISGQETDFRWTNAHKASISADILPTKKPISQCKIKIVAAAYKNKYQLTQRFGVVVNGTELGWKEASGSGEYLFDIPIELLNNIDKLTIELLLPDATSPATVGSSDTRILGLALQKIELMVTFASNSQ